MYWACLARYWGTYGVHHLIHFAVSSFGYSSVWSLEFGLHGCGTPKKNGKTDNHTPSGLPLTEAARPPTKEASATSLASRPLEANYGEPNGKAHATPNGTWGHEGISLNIEKSTAITLQTPWHCDVGQGLAIVTLSQ